MVVAAVAVVAVAVGVYMVGRCDASAVVRHGQATSVLGGISAQVDGLDTYDIPLDVTWLGSDGSYQQDGRPECLPPVGTGKIAVIFATAKVEDPSGVERDQVIWVDCTGWNPTEDLTPEQAANAEPDSPMR